MSALFDLLYENPCPKNVHLINKHIKSGTDVCAWVQAWAGLKEAQQVLGSDPRSGRILQWAGERVIQGGIAPASAT